MTERRAPTTAKVQAMIDASSGGANVKSGLTSTGTSGNVTFNTPFSSVPQVVATVEDDDLALRDCLYRVFNVSTTGFSWIADNNTTLAWIATDAGNS